MLGEAGAGVLDDFRELRLYRGGEEQVTTAQARQGPRRGARGVRERRAGTGEQPWPVADMAAVMRATFAIRDGDPRARRGPVGLRVLVVSQYFPPEPGATQNRLGDVRARPRRARPRRDGDLRAALPPGGRVPARATGGGRVMTEHEDGVHGAPRLWVAASPVQDDRAAAGLLRHVRRRRAAAVGALARRHDVVFASSPPLPGVLDRRRRRPRRAAPATSPTSATSGRRPPRRSASSPTRG